MKNYNIDGFYWLFLMGLRETSEIKYHKNFISNTKTTRGIALLFVKFIPLDKREMWED